MEDISNHKNMKIVHIFIRYLNLNLEVQIEVFELTHLKVETADILSVI